MGWGKKGVIVENRPKLEEIFQLLIETEAPALKSLAPGISVRSCIELLMMIVSASAVARAHFDKDFASGNPS